MGIERKLLEHLYNIPEIDYCDLIDYFQTNYKDAHTVNFLTQVGDVLMEVICYNNYILLTLDAIPYGQFGKLINHNGDRLLDFNLAKEIWTKIDAKLTVKGRKRVEQLRREDLQIDINNTQKRNSTIQMRTAVVVGLATIANLAISYSNYRLTKENSKITPTTQIQTPLPSQPPIPSPKSLPPSTSR